MKKRNPVLTTNIIEKWTGSFRHNLKSNILEILFIIKDILSAKPEKEPARSEFDEKLTTLREINSTFAQELDD